MNLKRRFPAPWSIEEQDACFVVCNHNEQRAAMALFPPGVISIPAIFLSCVAREVQRRCAFLKL
jgi:hypothetical protein